MTKIQMNAMNIWHIARTELRSCVQKARTWLLIVVAVSVCITNWLILASTYVSNSLASPIVGALGPRYEIIQIAQPIVLWFAVGMVFLAFDVRARDVRERMFEVVNVRPVSNFELIAGRLLGVTLPLLVPAILLVAWFWFHGLLATHIEGGMGAAVESVSVLSFLTWDILPNLLLWGSLTMLFAVVLRNRMLTAITVLGMMAFYSALYAAMPLYLKTGLSPYSGEVLQASDLAPQFLSWDILFNRTGVVLLAFSFLVLAACLYPRLISPATKPKWLGAGVGLLLLGGSTLGGLGYAKILDLQRFEQWAAVHKAHQSQQQTDVDSIRGRVEIHPAKTIKLDLELVLTPQLEESSEVWLFALNPGYRIKQLAVDDEVLDQDDYEFADGLLRIPTQTMDTGGTVHLVAQGVPDPLFAYLDSALDWKTMEPTRAKRIAILGQRAYVFHPQFVALLSGVSWFPTAGAAYGRDILETHRRDFFHLDLEVSVPEDWLVAGPGARENVAGSDNRFRFNPSQPVPEFALITSKFARRAFTTHGIEFELLLSPQHTKNLSVLEPIVPALQEWVGNQIASLQDAGLNYPFGTLSFVEVPFPLRVYGGGWKMGSAYSSPGIHMIRESGFPIAQFERALPQAQAYVESYTQANSLDENETEEDVRARYLFDYVKNYFQNDMHGGSPMLSIGEQFLGYQAIPHGRGATALHAFVNLLMSHLALDGDGLFSIYLILDKYDSMYMRSNPDDYFARNFIAMTESALSTPAGWDLALRTSLANLDFETQPRVSGEVIALKCYALSRTLRELVPLQNISEFLRELIAQYRGHTYSPDAFFRIAQDRDIDFEFLVGDWLHSTDLSGFLTQEPVLELIPNGDGFDYQTSFLLRNNEPAPGVVSVSSYLVGERPVYLEGNWSDTVHVPGNTTVRIALHSTDQPVASISLYPHIDLHLGGALSLHTQYEDVSPPIGTPLPYVEEHHWVPAGNDAVIVDDLSEGFTIVNKREYRPPSDNPPFFAYFSFSGPDTFNPQFINGLPDLYEAFEFAKRGDYSIWFRSFDRTSYGKYSRSYAVNPMGGNDAHPQFTAQLPQAVRWNLEFHVPSTRRNKYPFRTGNLVGTLISTSPRKLGVHKFDIDVGQTHTAELDLSGAPLGWNKIGVFETSSQEVRVTVVEVTDGVAIADAVRWTPVE